MNLFDLIATVSSDVIHVFSEIFRSLKMLLSITNKLNNCIVTLLPLYVSLTELIFHSLLLT